MANKKCAYEIVADCAHGGNNVEFMIGNQCMNIYAGPGEDLSFEIFFITYFRKTEDEAEDEYEVFNLEFPLAKDEFDAAIDSSMEDFIFKENVDSLVAQRVAKDVFSSLLAGVLMGEGSISSDDKIVREWEAYAKYLIHERMAGRTIAEYESGFEPENEEQ